MPIFVGFPLMIGVMSLGGLVLRFERARTYGLLGEMPPLEHPASLQPTHGFFAAFVHSMSNPDNWKGIILMIVKLITGIISFTFVVTLFSLCLGFLSCPLVYYILLNAIDVDIYETGLLALFFDLDPLETSIIYFIIGVFLTRYSLKTLRVFSEAYLRVIIMLVRL
jgi:hypothetical protein